MRLNEVNACDTFQLTLLLVKYGQLSPTQYCSWLLSPYIFSFQNNTYFGPANQTIDCSFLCSSLSSFLSSHSSCEEFTMSHKVHSLQFPSLLLPPLPQDRWLLDRKRKENKKDCYLILLLFLDLQNPDCFCLYVFNIVFFFKTFRPFLMQFIDSCPSATSSSLSKPCSTFTKSSQHSVSLSLYYNFINWIRSAHL